MFDIIYTIKQKWQLVCFVCFVLNVWSGFFEAERILHITLSVSMPFSFDKKKRELEGEDRYKKYI